MTKWRHPICSDCISYLTRKRNFMWATVLQIKPLLYVILHGTLKHQQIPHFKVPSEVFTYYKNWFPICLFIQDNSFSSATLLSALQCIQCSTPPVLEQAQALGVQSLLKCCEKPIPKFDNKSLGLEQWDLKTHNSHNSLSHPFGHVIVLLRAPSLQHSCDFSVEAHSCRSRPARIAVPQQNKSVGAGAPNWGESSATKTIGHQPEDLYPTIPSLGSFCSTSFLQKWII